VDGCDPAAKLIVETDGRRWHTRIAQLKLDHDRDREAARAGYETLRFLHEDVVANLDATIAEILEVRDARLALFAAASRGNDVRFPHVIASAK
jgi:very-short-patch-repair endonuclease